MIEKNRSTSSSRFEKSFSLFPYESQRQLPDMRVVDTSEIRQEWMSEFICSVCNHTLRRTKVTPCLHRFCAGCISGSRRCPTCNEPIFKKSLVKNDSNTDAIIDKFLISQRSARIRKSVSELNHLFFSNRRTSRRWQNGIPNGSLLKPDNLPTTSSPNRRVRPLKRSFEPAGSDVEMRPRLVSSSSSFDSATARNIVGSSGSSSVSAISEVTKGTDSPVTSGLNDVSSKGTSGEISGSKRTPLNALSSDAAKSLSRNYEGQKCNTTAKGAENTGAKCNSLQTTAGSSSLSIAVRDTNSAHCASKLSEQRGMTSTPTVNGAISTSANTKHESGQGPSSSVNTPISAEEIFFLLRQHLYPDCETEVILSPHASVFADEDIARSAKRPHFIFCELQAKVEHLCAYVMRRTAIAMKGRVFKKKVEICPVKMELSAKDIFVMNMAGEGRYSTVEVCPPAEANSVRLFSTEFPFKALDEERTLESLKEEYIGERIKPLRLVYRFVNDAI